uniref:JmjC domain-containing protein n=1 Tax=Hanusia phi TaxID=3032 RepID=A0A7S0F3M4_9CRYP
MQLKDSLGVAFEFKVEHLDKFYTLARFAEEESGRKKFFADKAKDANSVFWEHIHRTNSCTFLYGSDLTGTACSEDTGNWNLEKFSNDSLLGMIRSSGDPDICGVNLPMLYVGHAFAMFGWHIEDNALYSLNYMHKGSAKTWYGIPGHEAQSMEEVAKSLFERKDDPSCRLYQKL